MTRMEPELEDKKRRHLKKRAATDSSHATNLADLHEAREGGADPPGAARHGIHGSRAERSRFLGGGGGGESLEYSLWFDGRSS